MAFKRGGGETEGGIEGEETVGNKGVGVNPELNCTLMRAIQGEEARETRAMAGGGAG
jgi:hypothetical protein